MNITIFSTVSTLIEDVTRAMVVEMQSGMGAGLISVAQVSISLYVLIYGYMVLAGKIQTPIADLLWTLAKFGIILAFITNASGYLTMSNEAIKGLKTFFNGGEVGLGLLDSRLEAVAVHAIDIWEKADGIKDSIVAVFQVIGFVPLLLGFIACGAMLIYTEITLQILLATAPLFIFCLMWGFLRDSFNRWLSAIISNCLIILFTNVVLQLSFSFARQASESASQGNLISPLIMYLVAGGLTIMSVKWGREVALNLGSVSVDRGISGRTSSASAKVIGESANKGAKALNTKIQSLTRR